MPISVDTLKANLGSVAKIFLWDVQIPNPVGGGDPTTINLRAQSSQIPGRSVSVIEIPYKQGANLQFIGKLKYDHTWTCEFLEGEDRATFDWIYAWCQQMVNDDSNLSEGEGGGRTDLYLTLVTTGNDVYNKIRMKDCFIESVGAVALQYSDETTPIKFSVQFRYNSWEYVS